VLKQDKHKYVCWDSWDLQNIATFTNLLKFLYQLIFIQAKN